MSSPQVVKLLVGNKVDKERVVTRAQAEEYARSKGMLFLETRCVFLHSNRFFHRSRRIQLSMHLDPVISFRLSHF